MCELKLLSLNLVNGLCGKQKEKYYRDGIQILDYTYEYYGDDSLNVA